MADVALATALEKEVWRKKFFKEYVRGHRYAKLMGKDENSIIQVVEDLMKQNGDKINIPLIGKLSNAGVTGTSTLTGNEEELDNFNHKLTVDMIRNAVRRHKMTQQKTEIDLLDAARTMLKLWHMENLRDAILDTAGSPVRNSPLVKYADATEGQKDTWVDDNSDRVLFGDATSNRTANDHSASLANIDNTNDKLTTLTISLLKRRARLASPIIRPMIAEGDEEWYVLLCHPLCFRDIKQDTTMTQANRDAWIRGKKNPLFTDGDLLWDGVIVREEPAIDVLTGVGAGGIDVGQCYLVGAQAIAVGWAQMPSPKMEITDFEAKVGVATEEIRGVEKLYFRDKMHGQATGYFAAVDD